MCTLRGSIIMNEVLMQHGVVPKEWAWLNWTLLAQEGGKRSTRLSAAGTKLSETIGRHPQEMPSSSVMESISVSP